MYISISLHRFLKYIIVSLPRAYWRLRQEFNVCVPLEKSAMIFVFVRFSPSVFCLHAPQPIGNLTFRTTSNTSSYFILSRSEQLFIVFGVANIWEFFFRIFIFVGSTIPWLIHTAPMRYRWNNAIYGSATKNNYRAWLSWNMISKKNRLMIF